MWWLRAVARYGLLSAMRAGAVAVISLGRVCSRCVEVGVRSGLVRGCACEYGCCTRSVGSAPVLIGCSVP